MIRQLPNSWRFFIFWYSFFLADFRVKMVFRKFFSRQTPKFPRIRAVLTKKGIHEMKWNKFKICQDSSQFCTVLRRVHFPCKFRSFSFHFVSCSFHVPLISLSFFSFSLHFPLGSCYFCSFPNFSCQDSRQGSTKVQITSFPFIFLSGLLVFLSFSMFPSFPFLFYCPSFPFMFQSFPLTFVRFHFC